MQKVQKVWISSDSSLGRWLTVDRGIHPIDIAYEFGRAESGEIIRIWDYENPDREPDREPDWKVYWDGKEYSFCDRH